MASYAAASCLWRAVFLLDGSGTMIEISQDAIVTAAALLAQAVGNGALESAGARGTGAVVALGRRLTARRRPDEPAVETLTTAQLEAALLALAQVDATARDLIGELFAEQASKGAGGPVTHIHKVKTEIFVSGNVGRIR
jgi:hypothetical protein